MAIRVGVVGVAGVGRVHLERARRNPRAKLVGLADVDPAARERAAGEFGVPGYATEAELLERARPQAVILATPPLSHRPLTEEAAAAGVHVLCEKPMASSLPDCRAMIDACRRSGVTLMLGHKKRFAPALVRLRALIDGELGAPGFFIYRYPHPGRSERDWFWDERDGGGPLLENVVHAAYTLRWLFGDVDWVTAAASSFLFPERAPQLNCAAVTLRMRSGAVGALAAGMVSVRGFHFEDLYMACEGGVAQVSGPFDAPEHLEWAPRSDGGNVREETFAGADLFAVELDHFLGCVETDAPPETGGEEGLRAIELCLAWKRAALGDGPVRVRE
jgi:predicted dehydrogenase